MFYEYLLRRVYQTGRKTSNGADADIYRDMEHAYIDLEAKTMFANQDDRVYGFQKKFARVRGYVEGALTEGIKKITHRADKEDIQKLETMYASLTFRFYDKDALDTIINDAGHIFKKNGLEV